MMLQREIFKLNTDKTVKEHPENVMAQ
jgi:hypothetical protein